MAIVKIASFNIWGIDGKDVTDAVEAARGEVGPSSSDVIAIGFQEVWFQHQLDPILTRWVGGGDLESQYVNLTCRYSASSPGWKCLVPTVGSAGIPGLRELELGSGLALCVRGSIRDAFFSQFRGGYTPDSFAKKGMIAVNVVPPGLPARAIVSTHFHDLSNDAYGGARQNHLEQLSSVVNWINANWRVSTVVIGDFNIDSRAAYLDPQPTVEKVLYNKLVSTAMSGGSFWYDVNANANAFEPLPTQSDAAGAIDIHLLSDSAGKSNIQFDRFRFESNGVAFSDHQMVRSSWSEP
jgi:Endonuclease/Exonuclease/phosphatase family